MFDPLSKDVIKVENVDESNVVVITEVRDPEGIRRELIDALVPLYYPNVPPEDFWDVMDASEDPRAIAEVLKQKEYNSIH